MSTDHGRSAHLAAIAALDGMGPVRLRALLTAAEPEVLWAKLAAGAGRHLLSRSAGAAAAGEAGAEDQSLPARPLMTADVIRGWERQAASTSHTPAAMEERLEALGIEVLTGDALPEPLVADQDPPAVLFRGGSVIEAARARVAIVGTRRASDYGLRVAWSLGRDLADAGVQVVSGLALGIDAAAHSGALASAGARAPVMAVIGAGHHRPCPSRNRGLARAVEAAGAVISEVPPGIPSAPWRYPVRNRVIAGLSDVVVVVESASAGGSMSTVAEALLRDRIVMAVPGSVGRRSAEGCHDLLRDGAEICTGADDVLSVLGLLGVSPEPHGCAGSQDQGAGEDSVGSVDGGAVVAGDAVAVKVLELLVDGPRTMESLLAASGLRLMELSSVLATLEAASFIATDAGCVRRLC